MAVSFLDFTISAPFSLILVYYLVADEVPLVARVENLVGGLHLEWLNFHSDNGQGEKAVVLVGEIQPNCPLSKVGVKRCVRLAC